MGEINPIVASVIVAVVISLQAIGPEIHYRLLRQNRRTRRKNEGTDSRKTEKECNEIMSKQTFTKGVNRCRLASIHFTIWSWFWILYYVISSASALASNILHQIGYLELPALVLYLYVETFFCYEWKYLKNMLSQKTCTEYINKLRVEEPRIKVTVTAWHMESTSGQIPRRKSNGYIQYLTEIHHKMVTDHQETHRFPFTRWEDVTFDHSHLKLDPNKMTRLKLIKRVSFGDDETVKAFDEFQACAIDNIRSKFPTSMVSVDRNDYISGFESRVASYWKINQRQFWMNKYLFTLMSFSLLSWAWRLVFSASTQKTYLTISKKVLAAKSETNADSSSMGCVGVANARLYKC